MLCEKLENPNFLMGENSMSEGSMNSGRMSIPECYQTRRKTKPFRREGKCFSGFTEPMFSLKFGRSFARVATLEINTPNVKPKEDVISL